MIKILKGTEFLQLDYSFVDGEIITIDTENKTVVSSINGNIIKYLDNASTFFTLDYGGNEIEAAMNEPVVVKAEFYNRFVGV